VGMIDWIVICLCIRSLTALLFSPKQGKDAAKIVRDGLVRWLQMLQAKTPGATVFLVCSHAKSPPEGWSVVEVQDLADNVKKEVVTMFCHCSVLSP
jgi:hypothetical protein